MWRIFLRILCIFSSYWIFWLIIHENFIKLRYIIFSLTDFHIDIWRYFLLIFLLMIKCHLIVTNFFILVMRVFFIFQFIVLLHLIMLLFLITIITISWLCWMIRTLRFLFIKIVWVCPNLLILVTLILTDLILIILILITHHGLIKWTSHWVDFIISSFFKLIHQLLCLLLIKTIRLTQLQKSFIIWLFVRGWWRKQRF